MSDAKRFLLHMMIVSVVAPALGAAIYTFVEADWKDASLLSRLTGSFLGGFVLLFFVAPITLPVGLATSLVCVLTTVPGIPIRSWLWPAAWTGFGAAYGLFWANNLTHDQQNLLVSAGAIIGYGAGKLLAHIWTK